MATKEGRGQRAGDRGRGGERRGAEAQRRGRWKIFAVVVVALFVQGAGAADFLWKSSGASDPFKRQESSLSVTGAVSGANTVWETNVTFLASNATTAQIDLSGVTGTKFYEVTNLNGNITLNLTNLNPSVDVWFYLRTDGTARTVTVSTNGITTRTRIRWGLNSVTNGATAVTATNGLRMNLCVRPVGEVSAAYEHQP